MGVLACGLTVCQAGQHWVGVEPRVVTWTNSLPANRVRLGVRDEGVYRVTVADIATAAGVTETVARAELVSGGLTLTCQGRPVAWTTAGDALCFYGVPTVELFAPENVYWLSFGAGVLMGVTSATPAEGGTTNQWFMHAESYRSAFLAPYDPRDRRSTNATLTNVLNFGEWIPGSATESTRAKSQTVTMPGFCASAATGVVARISAVSYYDFTSPDDHTCEVWLNGFSCGSRSWPGEQAVVFECEAASGVVTSGSVQIKIRNGLTSQVNDFMLLDPTLIYPRCYQALSDAVICTGGEAQTVAVDGFVTPQIRVWDITVPEAPVAFSEVSVWQAADDVWHVAFACGDAAKRYAVFDASATNYQPSVAGVRDTDWSDPAQMPEFAIVVPPPRWFPGFAAAVQPLADFRNAQGLRTRVIDAEELYNAFSDGLAHPKAFQNFSAAGVTNGSGPTLRYMLFAGQAGSDYKLEVFKPGAAGLYPAFFPLYLFAQIENTSVIKAVLLLPNDLALGNAVGGDVPEVAVGRFIATTVGELTNMVAKTIRYELTETWKKKAVFLSCKQLYDSDQNFSNIVSQTADSFVSGGWTSKAFYPNMEVINSTNYYYMNTMWINTYTHTGARYELDEGAGFLYYYGHSNEQFLGVAGEPPANWVVKVATLQTGNWTFAPVAFLVGCRVGRWTVLDLKNQGQCVAEAGVRNPSSGFTAVLSASGYLQANEALALSNAFRDQMDSGALRLGDAWCGAFAATGDATAALMPHVTFLGDPSLCIRAGRTARGTSADWLIANGLTGDPRADLEDQDVDGFATWQEYQAGTSPLQNVLRVRAVTAPDALATGLPLAFEPLAGQSYRILSTTNLMSGLWEPMPWRTDAGGAWSWSGIPGDVPVKAVEVPYNVIELERFYKVEKY